MRIRELSSSDFYSISQPRRVITHDHPRRFAAIDFDEKYGVYGLSWRSDRIEPVIKIFEKRYLWIGVDQGLAVIDMHTGGVRLCLSLNSNLLQLLIEDGVMIALTETEAIVFNADSSIRFIKGLPDLPDSLSTKDHWIVIKLVDDQSIAFSLDSGFSLPQAA